jgi:sec-independent protein translocase protein TatC
MPDEWDETPSVDEDEEGGGPVKSFLEHLEDLRWVLLKSLAAIFICMVICLAGGNTIMAILKWPLEKSYSKWLPKNPQVSVFWDTNRLATFEMTTNIANSLGIPSTQSALLQFKPTFIGTNIVLSFSIETNSPIIHKKREVVLLNLSPAGGFVVAFQLAIYGGIVLAAPFVIYFIWQFVMPALKKKEKRMVNKAFWIGFSLFFMGVCFCYFVLAPFALGASRQYSEWLGIGADQWTAEKYINFLGMFMLGMGLGFEMPVVLLTLVKIGILDYQKLAAFRPYMVVVNLFLGAVLTTPEVLTQILMFVPLQILYEISVWIAWFWERKEKKQKENT